MSICTLPLVLRIFKLGKLGYNGKLGKLGKLECLGKIKKFYENSILFYLFNIKYQLIVYINCLLFVYLFYRQI